MTRNNNGITNQSLALRNELLAIADDLRENINNTILRNTAENHRASIDTRNRLADVIENNFNVTIANDWRL